MDRSHTTRSSMWTREVDLKAHSQMRREWDGDSRRPRWRSWSVTMKLIYVIGPTLKQSPKLKPYYNNPRNPTTVILGMSNHTSR